MALTKVKAAEGRTVRDERNALLPADGLPVDLDTPHWHRRLGWGDIVIVPDDTSTKPTTGKKVS